MDQVNIIENPIKEFNYSKCWPLQYDNLWFLTGKK